MLWSMFICAHLVAGAAVERFVVFVQVCNFEFSPAFVAFEAILWDTQNMRKNYKNSPYRLTS